MNKFKENWLKVDETCPTCGHVTKVQKGLTKQNLKKLVTIKFNMTEVIITFLLIMLIVLSFVYRSETAVCRDWIENNKALIENWLILTGTERDDGFIQWNNNTFNVSNFEVIEKDLMINDSGK